MEWQKGLINSMDEMKIRHYLIYREKLSQAYKLSHVDILVMRPTPWKVFLSGFFYPSRFGFVIMRDDVLHRFLSNRYAAFFDGKRLKSNGDDVAVQEWSLLNVCKFCLEGFQYHTFLKFWEWRWKN